MAKVIAIAGGSCSGKTTLAQKLQERLGDERSQILYQDSFYIDQSDRFDYDGGSVNFDHPNALDFTLMAQVLSQLKNQQSSEIPIYDFKTHQRITKTEFFPVKDVIIVDGTLILSQEILRPLFDHSCFIECSHEKRLQRRLKRDVKERGRSQAGVLEQFSEQVEPMHQAFVEPSKEYADAVFTQDLLNKKDFLETLVAQWWL
ncbi:MAG: uridine kinase [Bdellovibrionales bacterium]|nr:uridine kinase [Bdellovibrionales bacterium]